MIFLCAMHSTVRWNSNSFTGNKKRNDDSFVNQCWERGNLYFDRFSNTHQQNMNPPICGEENYHKQWIYGNLINLFNAAPNAADRTSTSFPRQSSDRRWRPQYSRREHYIQRAREYNEGRSAPKGRTFEANTTRNRRTTIKPLTLAIQGIKRNHNPTKMFIKNKESVGSEKTGNENVKLSERGVTKQPQTSGIKYSRRKEEKSDKNETKSKINDKTPGKEFKQREKNETKVPKRGVTEQVDKFTIKSQEKTNFEKKNTVREEIKICGINERRSRIGDGTQEKGFKQSGFKTLEQNNSTDGILKRIYNDEAIPKMDREKPLKRDGIEQKQKVCTKSQEKHGFGTNSWAKKITVKYGEDVMKLSMNRTEKDVVNHSEKCVADQTEAKDMKLSERKHGINEKRSGTNDAPPAKRLKLTKKNQVNLSERQGRDIKSPGKRYLNLNPTIRKETVTSGKNNIASKKQQSIPSEKDEIKPPEKRERKSMEQNHFGRPVIVKNRKLKCSSSTLGSIVSSNNPISSFNLDSQKNASLEVTNGESSEKSNTETLVSEYEMSSRKTGASVVIIEDFQVKSTNKKLSNNSTSETDSHRVERVTTEGNFGISGIQQSELNGNYVVPCKMMSTDTVEQLKPDYTDNREKLATATAFQIPDNTLSKRLDPKIKEDSIFSLSIPRNSILVNTEINKELQDPRSRRWSNDRSNKIPMLLKVPDFRSRWRRIHKIKKKDSVCCRNLNDLKKYSNISPKDMHSLCCHVIIRKNECKTAKRTLTKDISKKINGISKKICVPRSESEGLKSRSITSSNKLKNRTRIISDNNEGKRMIEIKNQSFPSATAVDIIENKEKSENTIGGLTATDNSTFRIPESDAIEPETRNETCSNLQVDMSLLSNTEYSSQISENNINASFYDKLESDINKTSGSGKSRESINYSYNTASVNQEQEDDVGSNHSDEHGCDMLIQVRVIDNPVPKVEVEETPVMRVEFFSVQPSMKSEQDSVQDGNSSDLSLANNLEIKNEDIYSMPKSPSIEPEASSENVGKIVKHTSNSETEHIGEIEIHTRMQAPCNNSLNDTRNGDQGITITGATTNTTSIMKEMPLLEEASIIAKQSQRQDANAGTLTAEVETSISKEVPSQDSPKTSSNVTIVPSTGNVCETAYSSRDTRSLNATSSKEEAREDYNFALRVNVNEKSKISEVPTKTTSGMNPNHNNFPDKEICKDRDNETDLSKNYDKDKAPNVSQADRTNISKIIRNQFTITPNSLNPTVELSNNINSIPMGAERRLTRMPILASIPTRNREPQQPGLHRIIRYKIYKILNSYILLTYQLVSVAENLKTIGQQFNITPDLNHIKTTIANVRALHGSFLLDCLCSHTPGIINSNLSFNSILHYLSQMIQNPAFKPMITRYIYELICCHRSRYEENQTLKNFKHFIENDLAAQHPIHGRNITSEQYVILRSQIFAYLTVRQGTLNRRSAQVPDRRCDYPPITNPYASHPPYNISISSPSPIATVSPRINPTLLYPSPPISNTSSPPAVISANDNLASTDSIQAAENMSNMEFPISDVKPSSSLMANTILKLKDEPDEIIDLTLLDENDTKEESSEPTKDIVNESGQLLILKNRKCLCGDSAEYLCACNTVMYCSEHCQLKDWTNHQRVCSEVSNTL